jgi:hypothetical protein
MVCWQTSKLLRNHLCFEIGLQLGGWEDQKNLAIDLRVQHGGDHKGVYFSIDLIFIFFEVNMYDIRHEE